MFFPALDVVPYKFWLTLALIVGTWVFKLIWIAAIKRKDQPLNDKHKNWNSVFKNLINFSLVLAIALVWLSEIQNFAISVAAFTVAIVIATKELLQCFLGFLTWMFNRSFRVGDWVQIQGYCGEVADIDWVKFRILEVNFENGYAYTGKSIIVLNSALLTQSITNLNFMRRYVMHQFSICRDNSINLFELREPILKEIELLIAPFQDVALRYSNLISKRLDIEATSTEPFIDIHTTDTTKQVISITIFCPTHEAHNLEQRITEAFMALWFARKNKALEKDPVHEKGQG